MNESTLDTHTYPSEVIVEIDQDNLESYLDAAKIINDSCDETIVIVQHEFGIYGGARGEYILELMKQVRFPIVTTLHTVLAEPDEIMRSVLNRVVDHSSSLVTLTESSADIMRRLYPESVDKLTVILHGIHPLLYRQPQEVKQRFKLDERSVLLTFGLLSRNKGIEYVLRSLPDVVAAVPDVLYIVVGATHPGVLRHEGESYRKELMEEVVHLKLENHVRFVDEFLPVHAILDYLQATDIYVATSLDPQQAVSGTMSYALGAGRPVVATRFAQAIEVVDDKVGRVVPMKDASALSGAFIGLFADRAKLESMNHEAYARTRSMLWTNVADDYCEVVDTVARNSGLYVPRNAAVKWDHLDSMTNRFGMLQFADQSVPSKRSGYTLDDNSRALQIVMRARKMGLMSPHTFRILSKRYLQVMSACLEQMPAVNYLSEKSALPTTQNTKEDLSDSMARAYYALQEARWIDDRHISSRAAELLAIVPDEMYRDTHIRTQTQLLLGSVVALNNGDESASPVVRELADKLLESYRTHSTKDWHWFDATMTYASGQMCMAMFEAARVTGSEIYLHVGRESLEFLIDRCFMGDVYAPIGQAGWHNKDGSRALFDQQPEDTFSTMLALESAMSLTGNQDYLGKIRKAFSWFMGNNLVGLRVYNDSTGGCHDGLMPTSVNENEGAESTLSYLGARLIVEVLARFEAK